MFTNADALPFELAAVADATRGEYHPPSPASREPADMAAFAAYRRAWIEQRDRAHACPDTTAALILGAIMLRRGVTA